MSNTIDLSFGDSNKMDVLSFYWIAEFEDDAIYQFENGVEHQFKEVQDRFSELKFFTLQHKDKDISFTVDLTKGLILYGCKVETSPDLLKDKQNIRLIYFRRHKHDFSESGKELNHTIWYFLGFQYTDNEGRNRKIVLQIDQEGNFVIGG
jgi:hypothetical protein